jgi:hypothetical protein
MIMSEIEVKSVINLRKAAFIVKELRAILNNFESETDVDAYLHPDDYREILSKNTTNAIKEYYDRQSLLSVIHELRDQIQEANYQGGIVEDLASLAFHQSKLNLIDNVRRSDNGSIYTDNEVRRMIARQEKKEENSSFFGPSSTRVSDEELLDFLDKEEKATRKKIRSIQDMLTMANIKTEIELSDRVVDMITKYDLME